LFYREVLQREVMRVVELEGELLLLKHSVSRKVRKAAAAASTREVSRLQPHTAAAATGVGTAGAAAGVGGGALERLTSAGRRDSSSSTDLSDYLSVVGDLAAMEEAADKAAEEDEGLPVGADSEELVVLSEKRDRLGGLGGRSGAAGGAAAAAAAASLAAPGVLGSETEVTDDEVMAALEVVHQVEYASRQGTQLGPLLELVGGEGPPAAGSATEDETEDEEDEEERGSMTGAGGGAASGGGVGPGGKVGVVFRTRLPTPKPIGRGFSIWKMLKDAIGGDLTKITMPATINEPISFIQR
jgi:hypothetical protein